jgi:recombination protein RecT
MTALAVIDQFKQELRLLQPHFAATLPRNISPEKFEAIVIAAVSSNPKLLACDRRTLWNACRQGAELGLSLNPTLGEADILPVKNSKANITEAQFRPRYKGLMKLATKSGEVTSIRSVLVYENDVFEVVEGLRPDIIHKPARGDRGQMTHVYCVWNLKSQSEPQFEVMDREQVYKIRGRSPSMFQGSISGPWKTDEPEMWRKTVVRRASKYMPITCDDFQRAVAVDNIAEGGGEFDITEDGEVIDLTPVQDDEQEYGTQVDAIEASFEDEPAPAKPARKKAAPAPAAALVDFGPTDTWQTWCLKAGAAVKALEKPERAAWGDAHEAMLVEAYEVSAKAVKRIRELIAGAD